MPTCRFCGSTQVKWDRINGRFVMKELNGDAHKCIESPGKNQNGDANPDNLKSQIEGDTLKDLVDKLKQDAKNVDAAESPQDKESAKQLLKQAQKNLKDLMDELRQQVESELINDLKESVKQEVIVKLPDGEAKLDGENHNQTTKLMQLIAANVKVFISGPAGSGKTTACHKITPILGQLFGRDDYDFFFKSVCELTGKHELEGFMNASGMIVDTDFRNAYINGHFFLIDEVDAANPNVLTVLNATIENGWASFPDGKVAVHPHFRIAVAANTVGLGADAIYIGRNPLDGAFRNRFYFLPWEYDEKLEMRIAGPDQKEWIKHVQKIRAAHNSLGKMAPRVVVSPRASITGAKLIRNGIITDWEELDNALIWQGCSRDDKERVIKAMR